MRPFSCALTALCILPMVCLAGRPLTTDDAGLTEAGTCQLETWVQFSKHTQDQWLLPACNPFGNFEVTAGFAAHRADGQPDASSYVLQAKTLFRELAPNDWGLGLAAGIEAPVYSRGGAFYAYLPLSYSFGETQPTFHANLGWYRSREDARDVLTWATGLETALHPRLSAFIETFGNHQARPDLQTGLSIGLLPQRLHLDLTYGLNTDFAQPAFYSVGLSVYLPP